MIESFVAFLGILLIAAWPLLYMLTKAIGLMISMGLPFRSAFSIVNTPERRDRIGHIESIVYWTTVMTCVIYAELLLVQVASVGLLIAGTLGLWMVMIAARMINETLIDGATGIAAAIFYVTTCALLTVQTWNLSFSLGLTLGMVILDLLSIDGTMLTEHLISRAAVRRRVSPEKAIRS